MTAKEVYDIDSNESIMIQGIIDLYFIDKDDNLIYEIRNREEIIIDAPSLVILRILVR